MRYDSNIIYNILRDIIEISNEIIDFNAHRIFFLSGDKTKPEKVWHYLRGERNLKLDEQKALLNKKSPFLISLLKEGSVYSEDQFLVKILKDDFENASDFGPEFWIHLNLDEEPIGVMCLSAKSQSTFSKYDQWLCQNIVDLGLDSYPRYRGDSLWLQLRFGILHRKAYYSGIPALEKVLSEYLNRCFLLFKKNDNNVFGTVRLVEKYNDIINSSFNTRFQTSNDQNSSASLVFKSVKNVDENVFRLLRSRAPKIECSKIRSWLDNFENIVCNNMKDFDETYLNKIFQEQYISQIILPAVYKGEVLALYTFGSKTNDAFTHNMIKALAVIAAHSALVILNSLSRENNEEHRKKLSILNKSSLKISKSLDIKNVISTTLTAAVNAEPLADDGVIILFDKTENFFKIYRKEGEQLIIDQNSYDEYPVRDYRGNDWLNLIDKPANLISCIPLKAWNHNFGALCLYNYSSEFSLQYSNQYMTSTLGSTAAIAIHNALLANEIYDLAISTNQGNLSVEIIFEQVVKSIFRVTDAKGVNMFLLEKTNNPDLCIKRKPILSRSYGLGNDFHRKVLPRKGGLTHTVLVTKSIGVVDSPEKEPGINPLAYERGIRAYVCIPLKIQNSIIGVIFVHYGHTRNFSDNELQMLKLFSNISAVAIDNARLLEKINNQTDRLKALHEIGSNITRSIDLNHILDSIAKYHANLVGAHRSLFILVDDDNQCLSRKASGYNYPDWHLDSLEYSEIIDGISGWVIKKKFPARSKNAQRDFRNKKKALESTKAFDIGPIIVVPLIIKNKVIGTFTACNPVGGKKFSKEDVNLSYMLGNYASIAIENSFLFESTLISLKEVKKVRDTAKVVSDITVIKDLDETLSTIVSLTRETLSCDVVTLYTYNDDTKRFGFPPNIIGVHYKDELFKLNEVSENSVVHNILSKNRIHFAEDVSTDRVLFGPFSNREGIKTAVGIPLIVRTHKVGVMFVNYRQRHEFDDDDKKNIELFGNQAAVAIHNAQQYDELKRAKGLVGARTALAWIGMASSAWRHASQGYAITIKEISELLQSKSSAKIPSNFLETKLKKIERLADKIATEPITAPLSDEVTYGSVFILELIDERLRQLWGKKFYSSVDLKINFEKIYGVSVRISPQWFVKVLDIVIDNAIYSMKHSKNKRLNVFSKQTGDHINIFFEDSGVGISPDVVESLFVKPILKKRIAKGQGVGLLMAHTILHCFNGDIYLKQTDDHGTTMVIQLPIEL